MQGKYVSQRNAPVFLAKLEAVSKYTWLDKIIFSLHEITEIEAESYPWDTQKVPKKCIHKKGKNY